MKSFQGESFQAYWGLGHVQQLTATTSALVKSYKI